MKRSIVLAVALSLNLMAVAAVAAADFSADVIQKGKGYTGESKVYLRGNKVRMEPRGHLQG